MAFGEVIAASFENHTRHMNAICGQIVYFRNFKASGSYTNHGTLKV
jgi:hypothetical protein